MVTEVKSAFFRYLQWHCKRLNAFFSPGNLPPYYHWCPEPERLVSLGPAPVWTSVRCRCRLRMVDCCHRRSHLTEAWRPSSWGWSRACCVCSALPRCDSLQPPARCDNIPSPIKIIHNSFRFDFFKMLKIIKDYLITDIIIQPEILENQ